MSRYELPQLIKLWEQDGVTTEQTIGQLLLHLQELLNRVKTIEQQMQRRGNPSGDRPANQSPSAAS